MTALWKRVWSREEGSESIAEIQTSIKLALDTVHWCPRGADRFENILGGRINRKWCLTIDSYTGQELLEQQQKKGP